MSSVTLTPPSDIEDQRKLGGRSKTVAYMILRYPSTSVLRFLLLVTVLGTTSLVILFMAYSMIREVGYRPDIVHNFHFFPFTLVAVALWNTYTFAQSISLVLNMGFSRQDFWRGTLQAAIVRAGVITGVIVVMSAFELSTEGYWRGLQMFSGNLDYYSFHLQGHGFGIGSALIESLYFIGLWFIGLVLAQVFGALAGSLRLRWGILPTSLLILAAGFFFYTVVFWSNYRGSYYFDPFDGWSTFIIDPYAVLTPYISIGYPARETSPPYSFNLYQQQVGKLGFSYWLKGAAIGYSIILAKLAVLAGIFYAVGAAILKKTDVR